MLETQTKSGEFGPADAAVGFSRCRCGRFGVAHVPCSACARIEAYGRRCVDEEPANREDKGDFVWRGVPA